MTGAYAGMQHCESATILPSLSMQARERLRGKSECAATLAAHKVT